MKPYIVCHMMTSVDGRIDCPMVGQLGTDEYYVALEKLGPCSKLSGRVTAALECDAVKEETAPETGAAVGLAFPAPLITILPAASIPLAMIQP